MLLQRDLNHLGDICFDLAGGGGSPGIEQLLKAIPIKNTADEVPSGEPEGVVIGLARLVGEQSAHIEITHDPAANMAAGVSADVLPRDGAVEAL